MTELHKLTAASIEVEIGGKTYRLSPLSDRDHSELELWVKQHLSKKNLDYNEAMKILGKSVAGIAHYVWLSLRREHPDITKKVVSELTSDTAALNKIYGALDILNGRPTKKASGAKQATEEKEFDKTDVYRALSSRYGWTPNEIADMTLDQQLAYLTEPKKNGMSFNSLREYREHIKGQQ